MTLWITSGWLHLVVGIAIGWLLFKRPDWITAAFQWVKHKVLG